MGKETTAGAKTPLKRDTTLSGEAKNGPSAPVHLYFIQGASWTSFCFSHSSQADSLQSVLSMLVTSRIEKACFSTIYNLRNSSNFSSTFLQAFPIPDVCSVKATIIELAVFEANLFIGS